MTKIIEKKSAGIIYEEVGNYVAVKTARKCGVLTKEVFDRCKGSYPKILEAINDSKIFFATDEYMEHYGKYGLFQIDLDVKPYYEYIQFGYPQNGMKIRMDDFETIVSKLRTNDLNLLVCRRGCYLVEVETNKIKKSPVILRSFYVNYFDPFNSFVLKQNDMIPFYTDPENGDEYHGLIQHHSLEPSERRKTKLECIVYYPTDSEWEEFSKNKNPMSYSFEPENNFFTKIILDKYNSRFLDRGEEYEEIEAEYKLNKVKDKILNSLNEYDPLIENNQIVLNTKPRKIFITFDESY